MQPSGGAQAEGDGSDDIVVAGGGPVGCTLALALHRAGRRVRLLERRARGAPPAAGFRPIALSHASRLILERLGAWQRLEPTPIATIRVSQSGAPGRVTLRADDAGVPALGYVIAYEALDAALGEQVLRDGVAVAHETEVLEARTDAAHATLEIARRGGRDVLKARCLVHAEGSPAQSPEKHYGHDVIVARVTLRGIERGTAFERFTPQGPLALLPLEDAHALVWSASSGVAHALAGADEPAFLAALARACGPGVGTPVAAGPRSVHPVAQRVRAQRIGPRCAYVGNAAQTLHPVAGQGLNLGLRDAWDLAGVCGEDLSADPGAPQLLARYASRRRIDSAATIAVTDLLVRGFAPGPPGAALARGAAMAVLDLLPFARRFFARRMIFGASAIP